MVDPALAGMNTGFNLPAGLRSIRHTNQHEAGSEWMKSVITIVILVVTVVGGYLLLADKNGSPKESAAVVARNTASASQPREKADTEQANTADQQPESQSEADRRFAEKQATYEQLEKARRDLDRRLARMKMSLWKVELPKEQAEPMSEELMSAARLLQRPKLMGAFRSLEEIHQELVRVEYAKERVRELRLQVEAMKDANAGADS